MALLEAADAGSAVDAGVQQRITDTLRSNLKPVRPVRPAVFYLVLIVAAVVTMAALGVFVRGSVGGARALGLGRAFGVLGAITAAALLLADALSRLMIPGSRIRLSPSVAVGLAAGLITLPVAALIPSTDHANFARAALACFALGLPYGIAAVVLVSFVIRPGAPVSSRLSRWIGGLTGGLAGLLFLEIYCPLLDSAHVFAGHLTVPLVCAVVAMLAGRWLNRRSSRQQAR
jgi:hypothetical protein